MRSTFILILILYTFTFHFPFLLICALFNSRVQVVLLAINPSQHDCPTQSLSTIALYAGQPLLLRAFLRDKSTTTSQYPLVCCSTAHFHKFINLFILHTRFRYVVHFLCFLCLTFIHTLYLKKKKNCTYIYNPFLNYLIKLIKHGCIYTITYLKLYIVVKHI